MKEIDRSEDRTHALHQLLAASQTLLLSTSSLEGVPDLGYAPCVRDEKGCFYIFISELAQHTANLLANPQASVMFIQPESESRNLFARERAVFQCRATIIHPEEACYQAQLTNFQTRFGEVVGLLRSLSDFHLFALAPESGRYVAGFGQAYAINAEDGSVSALSRK